MAILVITMTFLIIFKDTVIIQFLPKLHTKTKEKLETTTVSMLFP